MDILLTIHAIIFVAFRWQAKEHISAVVGISSRVTAIAFLVHVVDVDLSMIFICILEEYR